MAMATGARQKGVQIIRKCRATNITQLPSGEWKVETDKGSITCEHVVNAGGTYARQMGEWSGLQLPMTSMTHHYFVTEPVPEFKALERELPVIRDDRKVPGYIRMEQQRGLIGIYEKETQIQSGMTIVPGNTRIGYLNLITNVSCLISRKVLTVCLYLQSLVSSVRFMVQ